MTRRTTTLLAIGLIVVAAVAVGIVALNALGRPAEVAQPPSATASASTRQSAEPLASPSASASGSPSVSPSPTATAEPATTMVAVGDLASCAVETDDAVAAAVAAEEAEAIALLGDLVYPYGSDETYGDCFLPIWGDMVERVRPAAGNHDLQEDGGEAYWSIFGDRAGQPGEGWYSYDIGAWHVVVANSNCELIDCTPGSPQHDWLVADLTATDARCVLAYWHHPMAGSGNYGRYPPVDPLWTAVLDGGVDLALAGHEHHYERFAPLGADVQPDPSGARMIIVGTGGIELRPLGPIMAGSEVLLNDAFGYLRLTLAPDAYSFEFVALDGSILDSGSGECR